MGVTCYFRLLVSAAIPLIRTANCLCSDYGPTSLITLNQILDNLTPGGGGVLGQWLGIGVPLRVSNPDPV